jgi:hypothetical protein
MSVFDSRRDYQQRQREEMTMFANCPALVLNADFQPLSYFPLSLFNWEDSVKAVVKRSHVVVAEYDQVVRSPSTTMRLPSVIALREYVRRTGLPSRGSTCSCGTTSSASIAASSTSRISRSITSFPAQTAGSRHGTTSWQPAALVTRARIASRVKPRRKPFEPTVHQLMAAQRFFPPNFLHETWCDYLYWDVELEK